MIRKIYGSGSLSGAGGILPPNDPRLADLTDEQIELDLELFLQDHPEHRKKGESYTDDSFEKDMAAELAPDPGDFVDVPYEDEGGL